MAYVHYIPPHVLDVQSDRPAFFSPQRTGICGPFLIFFGGASSIIVGFFKPRPFVIWPVVFVGIVLCVAGVLTARRHAQFWRSQEQERQRAMWRRVDYQSGQGADNAHPQLPQYDLPLYCLEAPCPSLSHRGIHKHSSGASEYDSGLWCALAVPLRPAEVGEGYYLDWTAMALVLQPQFKYISTTDHDGHGDEGGSSSNSGGVKAPCGTLSAVSLTRALPADGGGCSRTGGGHVVHEDGSVVMATGRPSLTLLRTQSLGRSVANTAVGVAVASPADGTVFSCSSAGERRMGRASRAGRMGDLLSLFAAVRGSGAGGSGGGTTGEGVEMGLECEGVQEAGGDKHGKIPGAGPGGGPPV